MRFNTFLKITAAFVITLTLGFYFFHQARSYLIGPSLEVTEPITGGSVTESFLKIKGKAGNVTNLTVNGHEIVVNNDGNFETDLLLANGYNIIGLSGTDKFGRVINKQLEIVKK